MPPTTYNYTISTDFPNSKVNGTKLQQEIEDDASITQPIDSININIVPDDCAITFSDALTAPEQAQLDAIVAAHQGVMNVYNLDGVLPVADLGINPTPITEDLTWQLIGTCVTRPSFFNPIMTSMFGNANGCHDGDGGQIKIVEKLDGVPDEDKTNPPIDLPDTAGTMAIFKFTTNVPPRYSTEPAMYLIYARLNGATNLSIQAMNFGIIEYKVDEGIS